MSFLHLLWIVPLSAFLGFQIGSIVELKKKYNFADLELDLLHSLEQKGTADEQKVMAKIRGLIAKAEFWRKG